MSDEACHDCVTIFECYLDEKSKVLFKELYQKNKTLKEIYQALRKKYPKEFRVALRSFLSEHSQATIYDKFTGH